MEIPAYSPPLKGLRSVARAFERRSASFQDSRPPSTFPASGLGDSLAKRSQAPPIAARSLHARQAPGSARKGRAPAVISRAADGKSSESVDVKIRAPRRATDT
jgi:hypothetical protein